MARNMSLWVDAGTLSIIACAEDTVAGQVLAATGRQSAAAPYVVSRLLRAGVLLPPDRGIGNASALIVLDCYGMPTSAKG